MIFQIGSADKDLALTAARTVLQDVSGIDLNCGCPKVCFESDERLTDAPDIMLVDYDLHAH